MAISMHEILIRPLIRGLDNMAALLEKGELYATDNGFDSSVLAQLRLFPNMYPLVRQVQIACEIAAAAAGRLTGVELPKQERTEVTVPDLRIRIGRTLDVLKSVTAETLEGAEYRAIEMQSPSGSWRFTGTTYLTDFALPNFYFHSSILYALLRSSGVEIGKMDFLGELR